MSIICENVPTYIYSKFLNMKEHYKLSDLLLKRNRKEYQNFTLPQTTTSINAT